MEVGTGFQRPQQREFWPSKGAWVTPVLLTVAGLTGLGVAPESGTRPFYEASAQVIPVIMLTLAIEARAFEWRLEWQGWKALYDRGLDGYVMVALSGVVVLLLLVIAEVMTLAKLGDSSIRDPAPKFVFVAMVMGFAAVILTAVPRHQGDDED
jgi:hypothetical protein